MTFLVSGWLCRRSPTAGALGTLCFGEPEPWTWEAWASRAVRVPTARTIGAGVGHTLWLAFWVSSLAAQGEYLSCCWCLTSPHKKDWFTIPRVKDF